MTKRRVCTESLYYSLAEVLLGKPFNEEFFNVSARPSAGTGRSSSVPHARISRSDAVEEHRGTPRPQSAAPIKSSSQRPHPSSLRSPTPHASRPATPVLDQVPRSDNHIGFRAPLTARDAGPAPRSQSAAPISPSSDRSHFSNILPATVHSSRPVAPLVDHSQPSDHPQIRPREPVAVGSDSNPLALPLKTLAAISFLEGSIHDSMQPIFVDLRTLASERRSAYSSVKENRLRQIRYIVSWWNMLPRVYGINGSHTTQQVPQSILEASHNWCSLAPPGSYGIFTDGALQPETILKFLRGELPALRDRTLSQVLLRIRDEDLLASFLRISPPRTRSEFGLLDGLIIGPTDLGGLMAKNARSHITWSAQIAQCWYLAYYSCQDYGAADKMTRQFPIYETDVLNSWRSRWPEYIDGHRQKISGITFAQMQTTTINQWVSQPWGLLYDFINGAPTPSEARKARNILVKSRF